MAAQSEPFHLFFTGRDDLRDGCIVIGEDSKPIFFRFETPTQFMQLETRTTIFRNQGEEVAWFDWTLGNHFGLATVFGRQTPMSQFVQQGTQPSARAYVSADRYRTQFEWRRSAGDAYDLYIGHQHHVVASFRRYFQQTPVGPSHAYFQYTFDNDLWLLEALVALTLNRWMDYRGV